MTFDEAVQLARRVKQSGQSITVIAIGKFLPPGDAAKSDRWGVSVSEAGERSVLWDPADFADRRAATRPVRREPTEQYLF